MLALQFTRGDEATAEVRGGGGRRDFPLLQQRIGALRSARATARAMSVWI
jgi:hypothetical protein